MLTKLDGQITGQIGSLKSFIETNIIAISFNRIAEHIY